MKGVRTVTSDTVVQQIARDLETAGFEPQPARIIAASICEEVALHVQIKAKLDAGKIHTVTATIDLARHARCMEAAGYSTQQAQAIAAAANKALMGRLGIDSPDPPDTGATARTC